MIGSHKVNGSALKCFRALGGVAHYEHGLAQTGGFFLDATAVGEDDGGLLHQINKFQILEGLDEEEILVCSEVFAEHLVDGLAHIGIEVHWIDEVHVRVFLAEVLHRGNHRDKSVAEVLAAVAGDKDKFLAAVKAGNIVASGLKHNDLLIGKGLVALEFINYHVQRINDRVAGDEDLAMSLFLLEVLFAEGRRSEIVGGDATSDLPVHLLRPGAVDVVRPETGLDMAHGNLLVEGGEGGGGASCRVTMDQDDIRLAFLEHVAHAGEHAGSYVVQVLPVLHDIQVKIRLHIEDAQHLVQHLPMLPSHAHNRLELLRILLELLHQRAHLDGLRAGSENEHNSFCHQIVSLITFASTIFRGSNSSSRYTSGHYREGIII